MKKNPVKLTKRQKIEKAIKLFESFRLDTPKYIDEIENISSEVYIAIGLCESIRYKTMRDGKIEFYEHKFKRKKPILASTYDGRQLIILNDNKYKFTDRGIEDI